jgi:hypothetical protein
MCNKKRNNTYTSIPDTCISIQPSFKSIIEFVRLNVGLINSIVDLKMRFI